VHVSSCASTQDWLRNNNAAAGTLISCDVQTDGRGTRGRQWRHAAGNIACSFRTVTPAIGTPSLLAAAALWATLTPYRPNRVGIKWPNDFILLPAHGKIAGILCEAHDGWVDVGIGINYHFNDTPCQAATDHLPPIGLATGCEYALEDRMTFTMSLAQQLIEFLPAQRADAGTSLETWQRAMDLLNAADACKNKRMRHIDAHTEQTGYGLGLNSDGSYSLQVDQDIHVCQAGSLLFEEAA
jgi:biotin-[acetyl-CoA-carboxylase] ligase BirA-like protein